MSVKPPTGLSEVDTKAAGTPRSESSEASPRAAGPRENSSLETSTLVPDAATHPGATPEIGADLAAARSALDALIDETYSESDLARQRDRIRARLAPPGSRVIAFPHRPAAAARRARPAMRWLAGTAAAGLVIGVMAGHYLVPPFRTIADRTGARASRIAAPAWTSSRPAATLDSGHAQDDEDFLVEMETVLNDRRVAELRALDHLTPIAVADRSR